MATHSWFPKTLEGKRQETMDLKERQRKSFTFANMEIFGPECFCAAFPVPDSVPKIYVGH